MDSFLVDLPLMSFVCVICTGGDQAPGIISEGIHNRRQHNGIGCLVRSGNIVPYPKSICQGKNE